jgi:hypothetical protein
MKKFLLILLLMAIPFQYFWAAAAVYCQHEKDSTTHFGHHGHQHKAHTSESDGPGNPEKFHGDCEYCHLFSHASVIPTFSEQPIFSARNHVPLVAHDYLSHIPAPPKRPNWPLVA